VYAQLANAVVGGDANHLVVPFDDTQDGHGAWQKLQAWYDGTNTQAILAANLRAAIERLRLRPGVPASTYINDFQSKKTELDRIPGEYFSSYQYRDIFLRNIIDPDYIIQKSTLQGDLDKNKATLDEMIDTIRGQEKRLADERSDKRLRRILQRNNEDDEDRPQKRRRTTAKERESGEWVPDTIELNHKGKIHFESSKWPTVRKDVQDWVIKYNRAVHHGEDKPQPPADIVVLPPSTDDDDHNDSNRQRRVSI